MIDSAFPGNKLSKGQKMVHHLDQFMIEIRLVVELRLV